MKQYPYSSYAQAELIPELVQHTQKINSSTTAGTHTGHTLNASRSEVSLRLSDHAY